MSANLLKGAIQATAKLDISDVIESIGSSLPPEETAAMHNKQPSEYTTYRVVGSCNCWSVDCADDGAIRFDEVSDEGRAVLKAQGL